MKKITLFLLFASLACLSQPLKAQDWNWDEWFRQKKTQRKYMAQQIAALQLYLGYLRKGYDIARDGMTLVRDIRSGEYGLHELFYHSLLQVSPPVRQYPQAAIILVNSTYVQTQTAALLRQAQRSPYLRPGDQRHLQHTCRELLKDTEQNVAATATLLQQQTLQMTDDKRLARISEHYQQSCRQLLFARQFASQARMLIRQRQNEAMELQLLREQYGTGQ